MLAKINCFLHLQKANFGADNKILSNRLLMYLIMKVIEKVFHRSIETRKMGRA